MQPKIAIIGGGPSAAFAHRACKDFGIIADVYSLFQVFPVGAFWIHAVPPSFKPKLRQYLERRMEIRGIGTSSGYAKKMWGTDVMKTSFPLHSRIQKIYHPRKTLIELWEGANFLKTGKMSDQNLMELGQHYDLVYHTFPTEDSRKRQPKPQLFQIKTKSIRPLESGICEYDGTTEHPWTRVTLGFGKISFEFPPDNSLENRMARHYTEGEWDIHILPDLVPETRPWNNRLAYDIIPLGRNALWDRKYLSHQAYFDVFDELSHRFGVEYAGK